jgi:hypothetical protein
LAIDLEDAGAQAFDDLHAEVVHALLDTLELDFAEDILDGAGPESLEAHPRLGALSERLAELRAAETGSAYLPVTSGDAEQSGPLLVPASHEELGSLIAWWHARVDAVDGELVILSAEEHSFGGEAREIHVETSVHDLDADGLPLEALERGRLLEFGFYGGGATLALAHPRRRPQSAAVRRPFPDPMRYVRKAVDTR